MCCRLSAVWMLILADIVLLCECKIIDRYEQNKVNAEAAHVPNHSRCKDPMNQSKHREELCNLGQTRGNAHEQMSFTIGHFRVTNLKQKCVHGRLAQKRETDLLISFFMHTFNFCC